MQTHSAGVLIDPLRGRGSLIPKHNVYTDRGLARSALPQCVYSEQARCLPSIQNRALHLASVQVEKRKSGVPEITVASGRLRRVSEISPTWAPEPPDMVGLSSSVRKDSGTSAYLACTLRAPRAHQAPDVQNYRPRTMPVAPSGILVQ